MREETAAAAARAHRDAMAATDRWTAAMESAGFRVEHYHGRWHWHGPAVRTRGREEFQKASAASYAIGYVVQWDDLGVDGAIVYPVRNMGCPVGCGVPE